MMKRNTVKAAELAVVQTIDWSTREVMANGEQLAIVTVPGRGGMAFARQTGTGVKVHDVEIIVFRKCDGTIDARFGGTRCGLRVLNVSADEAATVTCGRCK
jgi:hypothetical protein